MAAARRFTIGRLMVVVVLVAVDFAVVRAVWGSAPWVGIAITTLPTIDVLLLALPRLRAGNPSRPFWAGFEAAGWLAVAGLGGMIAADHELALWPIDRLWERWTALDEARRRAVLIPLAVAGYTAPLLLAAWAGGRLARRLWAASAGAADEDSPEGRVVR